MLLKIAVVAAIFFVLFCTGIIVCLKSDYLVFVKAIFTARVVNILAMNHF
jgi:hypothetical protein